MTTERLLARIKPRHAPALEQMKRVAVRFVREFNKGKSAKNC